jgi:hypothetical protein
VVTAYILIQTEVGKAAQVAKDIVEITGVQQAEDATGPYDVIVRAEARTRCCIAPTRGMLKRAASVWDQIAKASWRPTCSGRSTSTSSPWCTSRSCR